MKKVFLLLAVAVATLTLVGVGEVSASSQPQIPACPISAGAHDIVVDFGYDMRLFANDDFGANRNSGFVQASIPAGKYKVQLASWDGHNDRLLQNSKREYYHIELMNGSNIVAKSHHTEDLKDGVLSATWSGVVNDELHIAQNVTRVKAQHSAYFYADDANSVSALCAVLTPLYEDAMCNADINGKILDKKPADDDLCAVGVASSISGSGTPSDPWKWTCDGQGSAADASCSATKKQPVIDMASCPYTASGNDILVNFKGEARLFSQESWNSPSYTKDAYVPAGAYKVKLAAWDGHADRLTQVQPREYFHIELLNGSTKVAQSNHTTDLKDQVLEAMWNGTVNDRLEVPQSANRVKAMHSAYVDNSSANSVSALCALLTPIVDISCGDGIVQGAEQCDDGNNTNGDGCSSQCSIERVPVDEPEESKKCRASIGDTVWNDRNKNGIQDQGEEGISGVRVKLYHGNDVDYDRTNSEGKYKFKDLCAGKYRVIVAQETVDDGCYLVADPDGTLDGKKTLRIKRKDKVKDVDFGYYCPSTYVHRTSPATGPGAAAAASAGLATLFASGAVWLNHRRTKRNTTKA